MVVDADFGTTQPREVFLKPLIVRVFYQNVGREPAKNVRNWLGSGYIRAPVPAEPTQWGKNATWFSMPSLKPIEMCKKVSVTQQSIVYPSPTFGFSLDIVKGDGETITKAMIPELFAEVKDRKTIFFVMGCLSYETLKERRNSTFCAMLLPVPEKDIAEWQFSACPVGNDDF